MPTRGVLLYRTRSGDNGSDSRLVVGHRRLRIRGRRRKHSTHSECRRPAARNHVAPPHQMTVCSTPKQVSVAPYWSSIWVVEVMPPSSSSSPAFFGLIADRPVAAFCPDTPMVSARRASPALGLFRAGSGRTHSGSSDPPPTFSVLALARGRPWLRLRHPRCHPCAPCRRDRR